MKFLQFTLPIWLLAGWCLAAQRSTPEQIHAAIMQLPKCCLECVMPVLGGMNCNLSNMTSFSECYCAHVDGQSQITSCTAQKCPFTDLMSSEQSLKVICNGQPRPTRRPQLYASTITSSLMVVLFITLRCYSNYQISKKFWWDDGFLLISGAFFLCFQSVTLWGITVGFGLHIWNSDTSHWEGLLRFAWSWELIYIVVQTMTKVSVLLLYYRIFPQKWFRHVLHVCIIFMFVHFLAFGIVIVNACHPISRFWDKRVPGKCINTRPVGVVGAICSIVEDVVFLLMPIPLIWQLKLKTMRKIGVILILTIGVIACVASVVRLEFLMRYNETTDQIWDDYTIVILSQIELCLSIVCVCFPAIRLLFSRSTRFGDGSTKSSTGPTNSIPNTLNSVQSKPSGGLLHRIRTMMSSHSPQGSMSIPWVSTRAPQLSSIYITSHIELTEKNPSKNQVNLEGYETHIAASNNYNIDSVISPDIVHVDRTGNLSRKFITNPFRSESRPLVQRDLSPETTNFFDDKIGTAR